MHVRHPLWLKKASAPGAEAFAILFTLESFARATIAAVLPLDALTYLGSASDVSGLYFLIGLVGILVGFCVPIFISLLARRWIYSLGAISLVIASLVLAWGGLQAQIAGMIFRVIGVVAMAICLNLYVLDYISKRDLGKAEPKRVFYSAIAWTVAPGLGTFLYAEIGAYAAYLLGGIFAIMSLVYFWVLKLSDDTILARASGKAPNPIRNFGRFLTQPRLVLAWLVGIGRSSWWVMIFIYAPILAVETGLGPVVGGMIVSAACGCLYLMPLWKNYLQVFGLRRVLTNGFLGTGLATALVAGFMDWPWLAAGLLIFGALFMVTMDAVGNMTFMLAVHPTERPAMTSVYSTYRDVGEITVPGVFSLVLRQFDLAAVFLLSGVMMASMAMLCRSIHPRLGRDRDHDPKFREIRAG